MSPEDMEALRFGADWLRQNFARGVVYYLCEDGVLRQSPHLGIVPETEWDHLPLARPLIDDGIPSGAERLLNLLPTGRWIATDCGGGWYHGGLAPGDTKLFGTRSGLISCSDARRCFQKPEAPATPSFSREQTLEEWMRTQQAARAEMEERVVSPAPDYSLGSRWGLP